MIGKIQGEDCWFIKILVKSKSLLQLFYLILKLFNYLVKCFVYMYFVNFYLYLL